MGMVKMFLTTILARFNWCTRWGDDN